VLFSILDFAALPSSNCYSGLRKANNQLLERPPRKMQNKKYGGIELGVMKGEYLILIEIDKTRNKSILQ